jgi:acetyl-CoA carboxylase biotin carboxyl carrier protein
MSDPFDIDSELVRKLSDLLAETGLGEIEYEDGGKRIRVAKPVAAAAPVAAVPNMATPVVTSGETPAGDAASLAGAVTSPMVGTVYLSQSPGDPPLIKAGDAVSQGQTLMLIEAMKTFNEVKAPHGGTVSKIAVTNGQPVEFGELLAIVE